MELIKCSCRFFGQLFFVLYSTGSRLRHEKYNCDKRNVEPPAGVVRIRKITHGPSRSAAVSVPPVAELVAETGLFRLRDPFLDEAAVVKPEPAWGALFEDRLVEYEGLQGMTEDDWAAFMQMSFPLAQTESEERYIATMAGAFPQCPIEAVCGSYRGFRLAGMAKPSEKK